VEDWTPSKYCSFLIILFFNHRRSQGGHGSPKFYHILSFFALTGSVPNKILLLPWSQSIWPFPKFWAGYYTACNHFHTDGLHLSRAQPCSSVSILSHSTFLIDIQSSTDKTLATTQHRQTLQNSNEKKYCHSYIESQTTVLSLQATEGLDQGRANLFNRGVIGRKPKTPESRMISL